MSGPDGGRKKCPDDYPERGTDPGPTSPTLLDGAQAGDASCQRRLFEVYHPIVWHRYLPGIPPKSPR